MDKFRRNIDNFWRNAEMLQQFDILRHFSTINKIFWHFLIFFDKRFYNKIYVVKWSTVEGGLLNKHRTFSYYTIIIPLILPISFTTKESPQKKDKIYEFVSYLCVPLRTLVYLCEPCVPFTSNPEECPRNKDKIYAQVNQFVMLHAGRDGGAGTAT